MSEEALPDLSSWLLTDNFVVAPSRSFAHDPARRYPERPSVSGERPVVAPDGR